MSHLDRTASRGARAAGLRLLLTADYEIFGDGSGCVERCLIEPSRELMEICEAAGTRVTFFVDVCEYWAFKGAEARGELPAAYRPGTWIEQQLIEAVSRRHDVQLHFHPQWLRSSYDPERGWLVDAGLARLPSLADSRGARSAGLGLEELFRRGRDTLETLLGAVDPSYRCRAFRAGAWSIQPEAAILRAMKRAGIELDSTVAPGCFRDDDIARYDFRGAPRGLASWGVRDDLHCSVDSAFVHEVPIFTRSTSASERLCRLLARRRRRIRRRPAGCARRNGERKRARHWRTRRARLGTRFEMFGFCGVTSEEMKTMVDAARRDRTVPRRGAVLPVVAIGHPKDFANGAELIDFLDWVRRQDDITVEPIDEAGFWQTALPPTRRRATPARG